MGINSKTAPHSLSLLLHSLFTLSDATSYDNNGVYQITRLLVLRFTEKEMLRNLNHIYIGKTAILVM